MGNSISKELCQKCNIEYNKYCNQLLSYDNDGMTIICRNENTHCDQCCTTYCNKCENHCCYCSKSYLIKKDIIHCLKCHNEHNIGYCCVCEKEYPTIDDHCCICQIWTNKNYETHCCLCSSNHRLDYCCLCQKSWNIRIEKHCCKCNMIYQKNLIHKCKCKHNISTDSLPTDISSEYDKISEKSYTQ
jgi:hypothetical protein